MPNSLRSKLSSLRYKGKITEEEYKDLISKLDGHDKALRTPWIPCSERLPEEYGEYMITWTTSHSMVNGKYSLLGIAEYELSSEYDHENNRFRGEWLLEDYIKNYPNVKVTAWMPLPEPYKAESEDEE